MITSEKKCYSRNIRSRERRVHLITFFPSISFCSVTFFVQVHLSRDSNLWSLEQSTSRRIFAYIPKKKCKEYENKHVDGARSQIFVSPTFARVSSQGWMKEPAWQSRWDECEGENERRTEVEGDDVDDDAMRTTTTRWRRDSPPPTWRMYHGSRSQTTRTSGHRCGNDRQAARSAVTIVDR